MPVVVNLGASLMFGSAVAAVARRSPAFRRDFTSWPFLFLVGFEAVVATPMTTYLFRFYPQWSLLYWFDPQVFPNLEGWFGWLSLLAVLANIAAALGGYTITRTGIVAAQTWIAWAPAMIATLLIGYVAIAYADRLIFVGDYDDFWQGERVILFKRAAGWVGTLFYLSMIGFVVWLQNRFSDRDPSLL